MMNSRILCNFVIVFCTCHMLTGDLVADEQMVWEGCDLPIRTSLSSDGESISTVTRLSNIEDPGGVLFYLDGFPPDRDEDYLGIAKAACEAGWSSLYIHYRGMWDSEGRFSVANSIEDVRTAVQILVQEPKRPIAIAGYSFSGYGALTVAAEEPEIECVISIDAADLAVRGRELAENDELLKSWRDYGDSQIGPGLPFHTLDIDELLDDHMNLPESAALKYLAEHIASKKLLLISSNIEKYSPGRIAHFAPLLESLVEAKSLSLRTELVDADHDFAGKHDQVRRIVTNWLNEECGPVIQ